MDSAAIVGTLLDAIPTELHEVITSFARQFQAFLIAPYTSDDLEWLLGMRQQFTIFRFDNGMCEVQPWKLQNGLYKCVGFHGQLSYRNIMRLSRKDQTVQSVINRVITRGSLILRDPFNEDIPDVLDVASYSALVEKRLEESGASSEAPDKLVLEFLHETVGKLRSQPISLEMYLRSCVDALGLCQSIPHTWQKRYVDVSDDELNEKSKAYQLALETRWRG